MKGHYLAEMRGFFMFKLLPRYNSAPIDDDRIHGLVLADSIAGAPKAAAGLALGGIEAQVVAIVDASGVQITTFGGGTQYANGAAQATPTGTVALGWDGANVRALSTNSSGQLLLGTVAISGTVTANAGTNLNTSLLALETGGNLATIVTNTNKIPALGQALAAASVPVILPSATITTLTPPSNTGYALDSSLSTINTSLTDVATLGAKTDAKSIATDTTSVSIMQVLKEISAMAQAPASTPVTGTFWQATQAVSLALLPALAAGTNVIGHVVVDTAPTTAVTGTFYQATQPVSIATAPVLVAGSAIIGKVGIDQTTIGTTNGVTPVPAVNSGWLFSYRSALAATVVQIKGGAATFGGYINLFNPNTATTYIQVFNKLSANVTLGTTAPDFVITLPGIATASATGSDRNLEMTHGVALSTGYSVAATTTATGLTAPASAAVATLLYK